MTGPEKLQSVRTGTRPDRMHDGYLVPVWRIIRDEQAGRRWDVLLEERWTRAAGFAQIPAFGNASLMSAPSALMLVARPTPAAFLDPGDGEPASTEAESWSADDWQRPQ